MNDEDMTKMENEASPEESNTPESEESPKEPKSFSLKTGFWAAILIVVIVTILLEVHWYNAIHAKEMQLQTTVEQMQSELSDLTDRLQNQAGDTQDLLKKQTKVVAENEAAIVHLLKLAGSSQDNWILAEVEYLIRMANLTLHFQHNIPTTIALLKTADTHLRSIGSLKLLEIRKILAHDIVALEAIPEVDVSGIYLRLQALDNQVEKLPLIDEDLKFKGNNDAQPQPEINTDSTWKDTLNDSWKTIKKVIVIRHRQQPIEPLISLQRRNLLDLNLHMLFAQAQWALLQRQESIYKASLQQIKDLIQRYFLQTNSKTQHIEKALTDLQAKGIDPALPDISDSLEVIRKIHRYQIQKAVNKKVATTDAKVIKAKGKTR